MTLQPLIATYSTAEYTSLLHTVHIVFCYIIDTHTWDFVCTATMFCSKLSLYFKYGLPVSITLSDPTCWRENQFPCSTINVAIVITSSIVILAFAMCHVYVGYALYHYTKLCNQLVDQVVSITVLACDDIQQSSLNYQMTN